jgi:hypothetical protein
MIGALHHTPVDVQHPRDVIVAIDGAPRHWVLRPPRPNVANTTHTMPVEMLGAFTVTTAGTLSIALRATLALSNTGSTVEILYPYTAILTISRSS